METKEVIEKKKKEKTSSKKQEIITIIIVSILLLLISGVVIFIKLNQPSNKNSNINEDDQPLPMLMKITKEYTGEFWQYKDKIKTITFETKIDIPGDAVKSWDVSENKDGLVMAYIKENKSIPYYYDLYIQGNEKIYANQDSSFLFADFIEVDNIYNISVLDTSKVTDMSCMFFYTGYNATIFNIGDLSQWDVSNVTDMSRMFYGVGYNAQALNIGGLSKWNISYVSDMRDMFSYAGYNAITLNIGNLSNWDVSNATNMSFMFHAAGSVATIFNIGDLSNWNVDKVILHESFDVGSGIQAILPIWND